MRCVSPHPCIGVRDNVFRMSRSSVPCRTCSLGCERANGLSYRHSGGEWPDFSRMSRGEHEPEGSFELAPACHNAEIPTIMVSESRAVQLLSPEHAEGLRLLSTDPEFSAAAGVAVGLSAEGAAEYIAGAAKAREEGRSYVFVLTDGPDRTEEHTSELQSPCNIVCLLLPAQHK